MLGSLVHVTADVKNTGSYLGKEVVQLYVSIPEGKLDQPYQVLAAFTKTKELKPGESQTVMLTFWMHQIASFDEETLCDILEAGNYVLHIGNSSRNTDVCAVIELDKAALVQKLHDVGGKPDFVDWKPEQKRLPVVSADIPHFRVSAASIVEITPEIPAIDPKAKEIAASMSDHDLALLCTGAYNGSTGSNSVIGNAGITVCGAAGETTGIFADQGIPALIMADGPAGVRISPQYGKDEKGVYAVGTTIFEELRDLVPLPLLAALGLNKEKRSAAARFTISIAPQFPSARPWHRAGARKCVRSAATW